MDNYKKCLAIVADQLPLEKIKENVWTEDQYCRILANRVDFTPVTLNKTERILYDAIVNNNTPASFWGMLHLVKQSPKYLDTKYG